MHQNLLFRETTVAAGQTCPTTTTFNSFGGFRPSGFRPGGFRPGGFRPGGFRPGGFRPGGFRPGGFRPGGFGLTEESDRRRGRGRGRRNVCVRSKIMK